MKSSYKRLGDYIHEVNNRNKELCEIPLLGVSITKKFIPSIANIVGTNMATYKLIEKNQFAYGPVTSRNGDKISIALSDEHENAMVSQAYTVFDVNDANEVLPDYLMMWFRRPEFDRYARFMSHGSAREIFSWAELRDTLLPIPSPEKQRQIVKEYNVIRNRIALNNQLIAKLEETAQTIYKQWFVDFEFPDESGKPYKSNGGELVWSEELENDVPSGWRWGTLADIYKFQYGKGNKNPDNGGKYPIYGSNGIIGGYNEYNSENSPVIGHIGTAGSLVFAYDKHFVTYNGIICSIINPNTKFFGFITLLSKDLKEQVRGSTQPFISYDMLYEIKLLIPKTKLIYAYEIKAEIFYQNIQLIIKVNKKFEEINELLLGRMTKVESEIETVEN